MSKLKDQSESQWQDIFVPKCLQIQGPASKVKSIATHLRQLFPDDQVQIQVQFQTYSLLQKFQKKLQLEYQIYRPQQRIVQKNDWDTILHQIHENSKLKKFPNMDNMKVYKIMFSNPLECSVFYYHYEKKLKRLETEYNYIIVPQRKTLTVHLKNSHDHKISSFFVTELIEMKNKLRIRVETHPQIFTRARYSKSAVQTLQKSHIKTMILSRYQSSVFYSEHYQSIHDIKRQVSKILAYHASLIKFPDHFVNKYILKEIMRLIYFEIKPALKEIERYYDMPVEVDIEKAVILITDFHEVFTDGVDLVKESLEKLKILEIECDDLIEMKKIMQKAQYLQLVKFNYRYRRCFLLFSDPVTQKHSKIINKFCQEISTVFKGKYRVIIHFTHLFQGKESMILQTQRVRSIAAQHLINNIVHSTFTRYPHFDKVVLEPVELSVYAEDQRKRQMEMFLVDFVTNKKVGVKNYGFEMFEDVRLDESMFHEQKEQSFILFAGKVAYSDRKENQGLEIQGLYRRSPVRTASITTLDTKSSDKSVSLQLNIPFELPEVLKFEENLPLKTKDRNRKLEALMEKEFKKKLLVWKIVLSSSIELPNMKSYDRIEIIHSKIFKMNNSKCSMKKYNEVWSKKVSDFKEGEKGYICFVDHEKNMFVPIYKIKFISE